MSKYSEKVAAYFDEHPKCKAVYTTLEGFMFTNIKFAQDHNSTLPEGSEVETHINPNIPVVDEEVVTESGTAATQAKAPAKPAAAKPAAAKPAAAKPAAAKTATPEVTDPKPATTEPKAEDNPDSKESK